MQQNLRLLGLEIEKVVFFILYNSIVGLYHDFVI